MPSTLEFCGHTYGAIYFWFGVTECADDGSLNNRESLSAASLSRVCQECTRSRVAARVSSCILRLKKIGPKAHPPWIVILLFFQLLPWPSFLIVVLTTVALAENHCWRHACSHLAEIARSAKEAELHSA